jgi:glycyl-tRNA synthetase
MPNKLPIDREQVEGLLKRRFFYAQAFEIYGGCKGLYDFGPPGCAMKANMVNKWRKHFIIAESLHEIDATCMTPEVVLQTSGHVEKFKDLMVRDVETLECYRADHLLEDVIDDLLEPKKTKQQKAKKDDKEDNGEQLSDEQTTALKQVRGRADDMSAEELGAALRQYNARAPATGNELTDPFPFNLMFQTQIGPTGSLTGYLRPETAQGIFMNFPRLLEQNGGRVPFGGACIGRAFRNEICPRQGLLRVREFELAEIEYFVSPTDKRHAKFASVRDVEANLWPRAAQLAADESYGTTTIGEAVDAGLIANETLGYFIARTALFLVDCGAQPRYLRFRQHLANEMAHYACDCWDAELLTTYGWIECVGNADRACYDLSVHQQATGAKMSYYERFDNPVVVERHVAVPNKGAIGRQFKRGAQLVLKALDALSAERAAELAAGAAPYALDVDGGRQFELTDAMVAFKLVEQKENGRNVVPSVIEPSFGLGRIQYALLEQSYSHRADDVARGVLSLSPQVAPVKCSVLPLMAKEELLAPANRIADILSRAGISAKVDTTGAAIGRRYARTDEIGIPFGITVDYETIEEGDDTDTITVRERDSMDQVRVPIVDLVQLINDLVELRITWQHVAAKYPAVNASAASSSNQ